MGYVNVKHDSGEQAEEKVILTRELIDQFLKSLGEEGKTRNTIKSYQRCLEMFYDFLPDNKEITSETVNLWKNDLKSRGYSTSSVNLHMSVLNQILHYSGDETVNVAKHESVQKRMPSPELTRSEYLMFLEAVRRNGKEQEYLLVKAFAVLGLKIRELPYLTAESCRTGCFEIPEGKEVYIPSSMRNELKAYCSERHIDSGPVFITRKGKLVDRSNITHALDRHAAEAGLSPQKCSPSALRHLYLTTQADIYKKMQQQYTVEYDSLLDTEQIKIRADLERIAESSALEMEAI